MIYALSFTPHTYVQGTTHTDSLCEVEPMEWLRPRILIVTKELMGQCQHHMAYHVGAMPHSNKFLRSKILIMSGFMSHGSSLMIPIKT
jgi:hypothetical protein